MATMQRIDAILALMAEAQRDRNTLAAYKRIHRACRALELTNGETERVLFSLSYHNAGGQPYQWLAKALDAAIALRRKRTKRS